MQLRHDGTRWVAACEYVERDAPKGAGFRWDRDARRWFTQDAGIAARFAGIRGVTVTEQARAALDAGIARAQAAVEASRAADCDADIPCPDGLAYLPYQRAGIVYAKDRAATLIADEMGLGKTIQAIGVVNADPGIRRVLVVCPATLRLNWQREMERWLVAPRTIGIATGPQWPGDTDVVIINYDILSKHSAAIRAITWDLLIVDEAHYCKNGKAARTKQVLGGGKGDARITPIPAKRKLYLTGTPILNRPIELWSLLHGMDPERWSNLIRYATRYCAAYQGRWGWDMTGSSNLDELQRVLRETVMVRRLKADVLTELPPKRRQVIEIPANGAASAVASEQAAWAAKQAEIDALRAAVSAAEASSDDPAAYSAAVQALRAGVQVAFNEISAVRHETALAKCPAVVSHLADMLETGEKVVVMAHHLDVIAEIAGALADYHPVVLTGETSMSDRQAAVDRFQSDDTCRVFVGGIKAAGVGITLTAASTVVFAELDWTPGVVTQAEDRLHRIGQQNSVLVQHIVLEGSLDANMARTLVDKQAVIDAAMDDPVEAVRLGDMPVVPAEQTKG